SRRAEHDHAAAVASLTGLRADLRSQDSRDPARGPTGTAVHESADSRAISQHHLPWRWLLRGRISVARLLWQDGVDARTARGCTAGCARAFSVDRRPVSGI